MMYNNITMDFVKLKSSIILLKRQLLLKSIKNNNKRKKTISIKACVDIKKNRYIITQRIQC